MLLGCRVNELYGDDDEACKQGCNHLGGDDDRLQYKRRGVVRVNAQICKRRFKMSNGRLRIRSGGVRFFITLYVCLFVAALDCEGSD